MEQHVAKLSIRHHQVKHFLYNLPFMYYTKCPDDVSLIRSFCPIKETVVSTDITHLLARIKYPRLRNIHGYRTELMWSWWPTMLN